VSRFLSFIREAAVHLLSSLYKLAVLLLEWFINLEISEKILFLNSVLCLISVIVPAAYFNIFDSRYYVNSPVSITSIVIAMHFFASLFFHFRWVAYARVGVSAYFLLLLLSKVVFQTITKAQPYSLFWGFYLAVLAAVIYVLLSVYQMLRSR